MPIYGGIGGSDGTAGRQAAAASSEAAAASREVTQLRDEVARLKLVCAAVWELLKERGKLTEDDLVTRVAILDARDGVADGKLTRPIRTCVQCGRTVAAKHTKCLYCGIVQPAGSVFEGI